MAYKVFLDVNIIVDMLDPLRPFHGDAVSLFQHLDNGKLTAFYSESVITTVAYVIRKDFRKEEIHSIKAQEFNVLPTSK